MYHYVLKGRGYKAMPVKSDWMLEQLKEYIRLHTEVFHGVPVFYWGVQRFECPEVMSLSDYGDFSAALIGVE